MARMVRKQVYIEARQDAWLKRRAAELGVSEVELIRRGLGALGRAGRRRLQQEPLVRRRQRGRTAGAAGSRRPANTSTATSTAATTAARPHRARRSVGHIPTPSLSVTGAHSFLDSGRGRSLWVCPTTR